MKLKRVVASVLIFIMLLVQNVMVMNAEEASNLMWTFDETTGELYIEGVGAMPDYNTESAPWSEYSSHITKIIIGGDLTTVGRHAFKNCVNATYVDIESKKLEIIRNAAFLGCSKITTIVLPASLKKVENGAAYSCRYLKEVIFNGTQEQWNEIGFGDNQYLLTANVTFKEITDAPETYYTDVEFKAITSYNYGEDFYCEVWGHDADGNRCEIPLELCTIEGYDKYLTYIEQEVIISYGEYSYICYVTVYDKEPPTSDSPVSGGSGGSGGSGIESDISWFINGDGVLTIYGDGEIPDYEDDLPPWHERIREIRAIAITGNITLIGSSAFENCHEIEYVYIESDVEIIRQGAFENCHKIQEIYFPESIRFIEEGAFRHCDSIRRIHYRGTLEGAEDIICDDEYINFELIEFGCNCTPELGDNFGVIVEDVWCDYYIGDAFHAQVYIYDSNNILTHVPLEECIIEGFDSYTPGVQEVTLSYSGHSFTYIVTVHGDEIVEPPYSDVDFRYVQTEYDYGEDFYIEIYKIENGVQERVYDYTIEGFDSQAPGVQNVTVYYNDFSYEVEIVVCDGDNLRWKYNPQTKEFYYFGAGEMPDYGTYNGIESPAPFSSLLKNVETLTIGDEVATISRGTFAYCYNLKTINFGKNLHSIGSFAFERAESLESVNLPENLMSLGANAFRYCKNLSNVTLGLRLTSLESAFVGCTKLKTITLPEGLIKIGVQGFLGCDGLEVIYLPSTLTQIGFSAFLSNRSLKDVYYNGTISEWAEILIESGNDYLTEANIHCIDGDVSKEEEPVEPEPVVEIVYENVKTEYAYGEDFYVEVYEVVDGMMKQVYDYTVDGFDSLNPGRQTVVVRYGEYEQIYDVYVKEAVEPEPEVPVDPENAPIVTVSTEKGRIGDTVDLIVSLSKNTGFANLGLEIEYDTDVFTLVNVTGNASVGAIFTKAQSLEAYPYNFGWDSTSNSIYNGEMAVLTFEISENANSGEYPINVDFYKGKNGDYTDGNAVNYDENEKPLGLIYEDGAITVYDYIPGDINDDGYINNKDGTAILRYLAGWTLENINEDALDTDGDGIITNKDGTRMLRYLAGWDVELN